jgi:mRNA-degrading endonuclease RelE of RelBE toxin-antitoxin system
MGVETEEVPEGLDGNDGAGERVPFGNDILYEDLQRFPGTAAQIVQKTAIIEEVPSQDLRFKDNPSQYTGPLSDPQLGGYRFRIGDCRVVFDIEGNDIVVLCVGHRREIYERR